MKSVKPTRSMASSVIVVMICVALSACGSSSKSSTTTTSTGDANGSSGSLSQPTSTAELGTPAQVKELEQLYTGAINSGKTSLVIYGPGVSSETPYYNLFEKTFPKIHITSQALFGGTLTARLNAEAASGKYVGSLLETGNDPAWAASLDGECTRFNPVYHVPAKWRQLNDTVMEDSVALFGFVYNTDKLKASQVPTTWQQLLEPQWKGKIAIGDPAQGGISTYTFADLLNPYQSAEYGMPYLTKLQAQNLQLTNEPEVSTEVASGQYPVGALVWTGFYNTVKAKGAPLAFYLLRAQNQWGGNAECVFAHAPDAAAASLFMNWLFSPQAQNLDPSQGAYGVMPGAQSPQGANLPPLDKLSLMKIQAPKADVASFNGLQSQVVKLFH